MTHGQMKGHLRQSGRQRGLCVDLGLRDRVAIVSGSSHGTGEAKPYGLAREGAKVTICVRSEDRLREAARQIESSTPAGVLPVRADVS